MEVRPGYKQTEVGVIPKEWEIVRFSDLLDFRNGVNAEKRAYGHGTRFINVLEVITHSHLRAVDIPGRVALPKSAIDSYSVRYGDLVFNRTSETQEEVGLSAVYQDDEAVVFGGFVIRGKPKSDALDAAYSGYALRAAIIRSQVVARGQGAIRANVGQADLRQVLAPRPPLPEQRAIARALGDVDGLIGALDQLIAKKRDLKQAAMQQLLTGETRLPGFSGDWEVKRLGSVLRFQVGYPFSSKYFNEDGVGIRLVKNRDLKSDDQPFHYSGPFDRFFLVDDGDVLVGMDGDFIPCRWEKGQALLNQRVGRILATPDLDQLFACYFLIKPLKEIEVATSSTTVKHLSHGDIEEIEKPLPSHEEQAAIAAVLSDMDAELETLEARLAKTRDLKQGMMQELLTGRTRLI